VGAAADHPLADARELDRATRVDAVGAGAVLARDLADPGVDPESAQCGGDQVGHLLEAGVGALRRLRVGVRACDGNGALVEDRGAATREALDRREAGRPRRFGCRLVARAGHVLTAEGDLVAGAVDSDCWRQLTGGHPPQDRPRDRRTQLGLVGE